MGPLARPRRPSRILLELYWASFARFLLPKLVFRTFCGRQLHPLGVLWGPINRPRRPSRVLLECSWASFARFLLPKMVFRTDIEQWGCKKDCNADQKPPQEAPKPRRVEGSGSRSSSGSSDDPRDLSNLGPSCHASISVSMDEVIPGASSSNAPERHSIIGTMDVVASNTSRRPPEVRQRSRGRAVSSYQSVSITTAQDLQTP